jgi:hypothetical protein
MLAKCCNSSCTRSFLYLSDGKLFRLENDLALRQSNPTKEYFWLCASCSATMTLCISSEGEVTAIALAEQFHGSNFLVTNPPNGLLLSDVGFFGRKEMATAR